MTSSGSIGTTALVQFDPAVRPKDGNLADTCAADAHAKSCRSRTRFDRKQAPERAGMILVRFEDEPIDCVSSLLTARRGCRAAFGGRGAVRWGSAAPRPVGE